MVPAAKAQAVARFRRLLKEVPDATERPMFGQPAAFFAGHLFFGVFGGQVFVRLGESDRAAAATELGATPFAPMPGRPMREYVVLPPATLSRPETAKPWVRRAAKFAAGLPPKTS
jgi:TfoX/Sxy family transcriptional regulator of competence genes